MYRHRKQIVIILAGIILLQLVYPGSIVRPLKWSDGSYIGFLSKARLEKQYASFGDQHLAVYFDDQKTETTYDEAGIAVDQAAIARRLTHYPLWQRLLPFSLLIPSSSQATEKRVDQAKLNIFAQTSQDAHFRAAKNATAARGEDGRYKLISAEDGSAYGKQVITEAITRIPLLQYNEVHIRKRVLQPDISSESMQQLIDRTHPENIMALKVTLENKAFEVSAELASSWMAITVDDEAKKAELKYDDGSIGLWIDETLAGFGNQGSPTVVTLRDGVEVSRREGVAGRVVARDELITAIHSALDNKTQDVQARLVTQAVATQYERTYSRTNAGLVMMISDWQKEYPGMQASVYLRELGGGVFIEKDSGNQVFGASMYKLYVASYLLSRISSGQIDPNEQVLPGRTYNSCIDDMIRVSDNACPEAIVRKIGAGTFNSYVASLGFTKTNLANNTTSAVDVGSFLQRLQGGNLLNAADTARLLDLMRRQIYRGAIPAGSPGASVANKVGFYGGSWHDGAIVNGPRASYILVVMTKDGGSAAIKTLATRIHQTLNQ